MTGLSQWQFATPGEWVSELYNSESVNLSLKKFCKVAIVIQWYVILLQNMTSWSVISTSLP